jgi:GT2 family glycosyltransferase
MRNDKAMQRARTVAAVVLNYANPADTLACLASLQASCPGPDWILIVDNGSPDDSLARLEERLRDAAAERGAEGRSYRAVREDAPGRFTPRPDPRIRIFLVSRAVNGGYAAGNNSGLRLGLELGADAFWILNNDAAVTPGACAAMRDRLFAAPRPGLCGALICRDPDRNTVQCRGGGRTNPLTALSTMNGEGLSLDDAGRTPASEVEKDLNFISGACVMASRAFVETVGLMDEGYFLYCEEQDWAYRSSGKFDLVYAPDALVFHKGGRTTGWNGLRFNLRALCLLARSRVRCTFLHHPHLLPAVLLFTVYAALRTIARTAAAGFSRTGAGGAL